MDVSLSLLSVRHKIRACSRLKKTQKNCKKNERVVVCRGKLIRSANILVSETERERKERIVCGYVLLGGNTLSGFSITTCRDIIFQQDISHRRRSIILNPQHRFYKHQAVLWCTLLVIRHPHSHQALPPICYCTTEYREQLSAIFAHYTANLLSILRPISILYSSRRNHLALSQ